MPRFTIRNLLIGTAWLAVWGALILNCDRLPFVFVIPCIAALITLPFVAIGAILGNAKEGFVLGLFFAIVTPMFLGFLVVLVGYLLRLLGY